MRSAFIHDKYIVLTPLCVIGDIVAKPLELGLATVSRIRQTLPVFASKNTGDLSLEPTPVHILLTLPFIPFETPTVTRRTRVFARHLLRAFSIDADRPQGALLKGANLTIAGQVELTGIRPHTIGGTPHITHLAGVGA